MLTTADIKQYIEWASDDLMNLGKDNAAGTTSPIVLAALAKVDEANTLLGQAYDLVCPEPPRSATPAS